MTNSRIPSVNQSILIRRAKRRLFGALVILLALLVLSFFFVKNEGEELVNDVKVSFLETTPIYFDKNLFVENEIELNNDRYLTSRSIYQYGTSDSKKLIKNHKNINKYFIQIGIFSNKKNIQSLSNKIKLIGFEANIDVIQLAGKEKVKLTTQSFNTEKEAKLALMRLKNANFSGIIKQIK
jgi:hypothetical protein